MSRPQNIEITDEETAALEAGARAAEAIMARYYEACGSDLGLRMEVKKDILLNWNAWWKCQHDWSWRREGMGRTVREAIDRMCQTTDAELHRKTAKEYRRKAKELEDKARQLEKGEASE